MEEQAAALAPLFSSKFVSVLMVDVLPNLKLGSFGIHNQAIKIKKECFYFHTKGNSNRNPTRLYDGNEKRKPDGLMN